MKKKKPDQVVYNEESERYEAVLHDHFIILCVINGISMNLR